MLRNKSTKKIEEIQMGKIVLEKFRKYKQTRYDE